MVARRRAAAAAAVAVTAVAVTAQATRAADAGIPARAQDRVLGRGAAAVRAGAVVREATVLHCSV